MSAPIHTPQPRSRRRGTVEVYFLLYLSAIILLLGTTQGRNDDDDLQDTVLELLAPGFRVEAEKPALVWRFVPAGISTDSAAAAALEQDSTNIVTAFGTVDDLRFAIVEIEDTLSGSTLPAEAATLTRIGERSAVFRWRPDAGEELENRVYRVTVSATGRPIPPRDLSPDARRRILELLERGGTVSDSVTFTVNLLSINSRGNGPIAETPRILRPGEDSTRVRIDTVVLPAPRPAEIRPALDIQAERLDLEAIEGRPWANRITVTEPTGEEIIWSYTPSNLRLVQRSPRGIILEGTPPPSGADQPVTVTARRASDGATATTSFRVTPAGEEAMRIPTTLYVDQEYSFDIGGSAGAGGRSEVTVLFNGNLYGRYVQRTIPFAPKTTGQVKITRSVNGREVTRTASVEQLPAPSIHIDQSDEEFVIVRTTCFGMIRNRQNQLIPNRVSLKSLEGNATDPEEIVARRQDVPGEAADAHVQYWRIQKKEAGRFAFRMQAIDLRGSGSGKSTLESYPR